jgi:Fic family protein
MVPSKGGIMGRLERRRWQADFGAYGGRKARQSFSYDAYIPDPITDLELVLPADIVEAVVQAEHAVRAIDMHPDAHNLEAIARVLLRSESVASSRIEGLHISQRRVAEALFDPEHSDITARSVLNNILAMEAAVGLADGAALITTSDIQSIHRRLLNTMIDAPIAGVIRTTQNWIGGSGNNPLNAAFIPPPETEVPALLEDLCLFMNRDDLPAVVQAAIAHAQFETIHPFADGNGRVGRCLIHVILRRRGLGRRYVPPVSVVLAGNAQAYIAGLTTYREGGIGEWCATFAAATYKAAQRALVLNDTLSVLQAEWRERAGRPRKGSSSAKLIAVLPAYPVLNAATVAAALGVSDRVARLAIQSLAEADILSQISVGKRNRAWTAKEVFPVINAFEWDIATPVDPEEERRPSPSKGRRVEGPETRGQ